MAFWVLVAGVEKTSAGDAPTFGKGVAQPVVWDKLTLPLYNAAC